MQLARTKSEVLNLINIVFNMESHTHYCKYLNCVYLVINANNSIDNLWSYYHTKVITKFWPVVLLTIFTSWFLNCALFQSWAVPRLTHQKNYVKIVWFMENGSKHGEDAVYHIIHIKRCQMCKQVFAGEWQIYY